MIIRKKQLKEQIEELKEQVRELKNIVVTKELEYLREQKKLFDEQNELISNVQFRVKNVKIVDDEKENHSIIVTYQLPVITISLNEKGEPVERIPFFYSVNALGLISLEDCDKINRALKEAQAKILFN